MPTLSFSIASEAFDRSLLPQEAKSVGTPAFSEAVSAFLQSEFKDFGGHATIRVDEQTILVQWDPDSKQPNPLVPIVEKLHRGRQAEGIQLLELLLSHRPDDSVVLYNLGLALSDAGRMERAEEILRRAGELNPNDVNIKVALGVALGRLRRDAEAAAVFKAATEQDPKNPWAQRNLGGMLLKAGKPEEAIPYYSTATQLVPNDQLAWLGLADACRLTGKTKEAENAYRTAVKINPHSEFAEMARSGSNALSQSSFDKVSQALPRQDAVHYCLDALQRYSKLSPAELKKLTLELAMAGRNGFAVHDPNSRYRVKGLDGDFSGLAMVSFLYVAMQQMSPGTNVGFDLAKEYEMAKKMLKLGN